MKIKFKKSAFGSWKKYSHRKIRRKASQESTVLERRKNNASLRAQWLVRHTNLWCEKYGRMKTVEERRRDRNRILKRRR